MANKKKLVRLHLELEPRGIARLDRIREVTEASSRAEVLRRALIVYDHLVTAGGEYFVADGDSMERVRLEVP